MGVGIKDRDGCSLGELSLHYRKPHDTVEGKIVLDMIGLVSKSALLSGWGKQQI